MYRLEVVSEAKFLLNGLMVEVGRRRSIERTTLLRNVDMDDLLCLDVENWAEVERVGVLEVVDVRSVVHQSLLKSRTIGVALVIAYQYD